MPYVTGRLYRFTCATMITKYLSEGKTRQPYNLCFSDLFRQNSASPDAELTTLVEKTIKSAGGACKPKG
jgi:hypothetical protein